MLDLGRLSQPANDATRASYHRLGVRAWSRKSVQKPAQTAPPPCLVAPRLPTRQRPIPDKSGFPCRNPVENEVADFTYNLSNRRTISAGRGFQ
jgi:hypothetical protein